MKLFKKICSSLLILLPILFSSCEKKATSEDVSSYLKCYGDCENICYDQMLVILTHEESVKFKTYRPFFDFPDVPILKFEDEVPLKERDSITENYQRILRIYLHTSDCQGIWNSVWKMRRYVKEVYMAGPVTINEDEGGFDPWEE